jgi:nucleoside-diphosphate-sugar epimerase
LCRALLAQGDTCVPVVRSAARWAATGIDGDARVADLADPAALAHALADAAFVVSCAHARHAAAVLQAAPLDAVLVFLGSTRKFTQWPDAHGNGVLAGELAFLASGRRGVMLHPTMIYGAQGEDNVQRLARLLRFLPVVPLPGAGRALVQPIHQDDVTRCVLSALDIAWDGPESLVIAGPEPIAYAEFVRAVACVSGRGKLRILDVPVWALLAAARMGRLAPFVPRIGADEIRRLLEDKAFDIDAMRDRLFVQPVSLQEGFRRMTWH